MQPIDAHLKNASWYTGYGDHRLRGEIYADAKGRFKDGEVVITSPATDIGQGMFETRSGTVYQVEFFKPADETFVREIGGYVASCLSIDESENAPASFALEKVQTLGNSVYLQVRDMKGQQTRRFKMLLEEIR